MYNDSGPKADGLGLLQTGVADLAQEVRNRREERALYTF